MNWNHLLGLTAFAVITTTAISCMGNDAPKTDHEQDMEASAMTSNDGKAFLSLELAMYNLKGQVKHLTTSKMWTDKEGNPLKDAGYGMKEDTLDYSADGKLLKYKVRLDDPKVKHFARRNALGQMVHYKSDYESLQGTNYNEWEVQSDEYFAYDELGRLVHISWDSFDTGGKIGISYNENGDEIFRTYDNDSAEEASYWIEYSDTKKDAHGNWIERKGIRRGPAYNEKTEDFEVTVSYFNETREIEYY